MTASSSTYAFRAATADDLPLLRRWLRTPEVERWWGDPEEQEALLREDLDERRMTMLIVTLDDRPFAYAQHCGVADWPQAHLAHLPPAARAVDAFIGEPEMLDRGHGSQFLRQLAQELVSQGAPVVVIDPDADNLRARRAYAKAGFRGDQVVQSPDGPVVLMTFGAGATG